jgi:hypothetical protein
MKYSAHKQIIDVDINTDCKQAAKDEFSRLLDTMFPEDFKKASIKIKGLVTIRIDSFDENQVNPFIENKV